MGAAAVNRERRYSIAAVVWIPSGVEKAMILGEASWETVQALVN
jgi:hypothetical protein